MSATAELPEAVDPEITPITLEEINGDTPPEKPSEKPSEPQSPPAPAEQKSEEGEESPDFASLFSAEEKTKEEPDNASADKADLPAHLRAQLSRKSQEMREAEARYQADLAERDRQIEELKDQFDLFRREVSVTDPQLAPEVVQASSEMTRAIDRISKTLPPAAAREFLKNAKGLVEEYSSLGSINDQGYDERYEAFRGKLTKGFGGYADDVMRQLPGLEDKVAAIKQAVQAASNNSGDILAQRALKSHKESMDLFQNALEATLTPSAELSKADPYASRNIIAGLIQGSPEFKEVSQRLVGFLEKGMVPPAPLSKEAESGMTPEQRQQTIHQQGQDFQNVSQEIFRNAPIAYHALAALPIVTKAYHDAKRKLDALAGLSPVETRKSGEADAPAEPKQETPVDGFRPITMEEILKES